MKLEKTLKACFYYTNFKNFSRVGVNVSCVFINDLIILMKLLQIFFNCRDQLSLLL